MTNTLVLSDRESQTVLAALYFFKLTKEQQVKHKLNTPLNDKDILSPKHSLMHTITILSKLTGQPIGSYMNPLQKIEEKDKIEP